VVPLGEEHNAMLGCAIYLAAAVILALELYFTVQILRAVF
jgi:hypothetical protein